MTRKTFAGGWYAAALPDGFYAVLIKGSHLTCTSAQVALPQSQNLLFLDVYAGGAICGQGHRDDQAWLWAGGVWAGFGLAFGPRATIFQADGTLLVRHIPPPSGYRYIADDGSVVTAEATYADTTRKIYEYTTLGGITFGQGGKGPDGEDPLIALLPDGTARLLQRGQCRAIRVHRSGSAYAIAWSQEDRNEAALLWATAAEIAALPVYVHPPVVVPPTKPPIPPVKPPVPPVKPPIPPVVPPMPTPPTMTFDASLALVDEIAHLWQQWHPAHANCPQAHLQCDWGQLHLWFWRATIEGWSREKCLRAFYAQEGQPYPENP